MKAAYQALGIAPGSDLERVERRAMNRGGIYWPTRKARAYLNRGHFRIVGDHSAACTCGVCVMARR